MKQQHAVQTRLKQKPGVMPSAWGLVFAFSLYSPTGYTNPTGATAVSGSALLSNPSANVLQVVNTPGAVINWNAFSIASGETTRFVQLDAASAVLNRVTGGDPSSILGRLESNGRVFLVNPNGVVFGGSSVVDVAGLIASTRDITNENFQAGNYRFEGSGAGTVELQAGAQVLTSVQSPTGGQVWLIGKDVRTATGSTINAPDGQVVLAAGSTVQVGNAANGNMLFNVITNGSNSVQTLGAIAAQRGAVGLFADFVNHQGSISALNGRVHMHGGAEVKVSPTAGINADGALGRIVFESNNLLVYPSGNTHAVGGEVLFRQYQPSDYEAQAPQLLIPSSDKTFFSHHWAGVLVAYRRPDGNYAFRYTTTQDLKPGPHTFTVYETVLDSTGNLVTPRTAIGGPIMANNDWASRETMLATIQGLPESYWASRVIVEDANWGITAPRTRLADGGSVQLFRESFSSPAQARVALSNDQVIGVLPGFIKYVTPMTDGTLVGDQAISQAELYSSSGQLMGFAEPLSTCATDLVCQVAYVTPEGGVTVLGTDRGTYSNRSEFSQHWVKVAPTYTPGLAFGGEAGVAASFLTRPFSRTDTNVLPTPPPSATPSTADNDPPPVVTGSGSGASFEGIDEQGCNAAVCSPEVRAAAALVEATLSAQRADRAITAGGSGSPSAQTASRQAVIDLFTESLSRARTAEADRREEQAILRDQNEVNNLIKELANGIEGLGHNEVMARKAKIEEVMGEYLRREMAYQQTGLYRTEPGERRLVHALMNMDDEQRAAFGEDVVFRMQTDPDFGAP